MHLWFCRYSTLRRIRLCCSVCSTRRLSHSLTKFHDEPLMFDLPTNTTNYTNCTLSLLGLSTGVLTNISLVVVPKRAHRLCECHGKMCRCCDRARFEGKWDSWIEHNSILVHVLLRCCVASRHCGKLFCRLSSQGLSLMECKNIGPVERHDLHSSKALP